MSFIPSLVAILVIIIILSIVARFLKGLFKVLLAISLVVIIILSVLLFLVYQDAKRITNPQAPIVMILVDQAKTCTGIVSSDREPKPLDRLDIKTLKDLADKKEYSRLFIVHKELFKKNYTINISNLVFGVNQAVDISCSDNLEEELKALGFDDSIINTIDKKEFRATLFALSYTKIVEESFNPGLFLAQNLKNKNIEVYPRSIMFKLLQFMPEALFNKVAKSFSKSL